MPILVYFVMIILSTSLAGQDILRNATFSKEQAIEDFDQYIALLTETHPGLYRYTEKQIMLDRIDSLRQTFSDSVPFYSLYQKVSWLNASIRCSHSYVIPKADFNSFLLREVKSIPFYIIPAQGRFYVLFNGSADTSIKPGFEVKSINGKPIDQIAQEISEYYWTDGSIKLANNTALQGRLFRAYYYSFVDASSALQFTFIDLNGNEIKKEMQAVSTLTAMRNYKKNPVNKEVYGRFKTKPAKWNLKVLKDITSTAVLTIPGFGGKRVRSEKEAEKFMEKFMDQVISKLQKQQIKNLIIELRYNRGGWDIMGTTLLSYLLKDDTPIPYYGPSYAITNNSKFLAYSDLSEYDESRLEKELEPLPDGTFKLRAAFNPTFSPVEKREQAFSGNVYILMDEYTSSAASEFCAIAKSNRIATLVSQETNGTYGGLNSTSFINFTLANSGIVVNTPLVSNHLAIDEMLQALDRGVLPDHSVSFSINDILVRKDTQLEAVKKMILTNSTSR